MKAPNHFTLLPHVLILSCVMGCGTNEPEPAPAPTPAPTPDPTPNPTPDTTHAEFIHAGIYTMTDLSITDVQLVRAQPPQEWFTHELVVTIQNSGPGKAEGYACDCTYLCPGGLSLSGGANVASQGVLMAGNTQRIFRAPFHIYCAGPPAFLDLKLVIAPGTTRDTDATNNTKRVTVAVP